eukprot:scaffold105497_cov60-Phaeocystis_antarctica.AAC.5
MYGLRLTGWHLGILYATAKGQYLNGHQHHSKYFIELEVIGPSRSSSPASPAAARSSSGFRSPTSANSPPLSVRAPAPLQMPRPIGRALTAAASGVPLLSAATPLSSSSSSSSTSNSFSAMSASTCACACACSCRLWRE